jgi:hypothetical protein
LGNETTASRRHAWPYWLAAAAIAIWSGEVAYGLAQGPERYIQFTTSVITWRNAQKSADYVLLVGVFGGFALAWTSLLLLERRIERRLGPDAVRQGQDLIAYACLPLIIWAASLVIGTPLSRFPVKLTAVGVCVAAFLLLLATFRSARSRGSASGCGPGAAARGRTRCRSPPSARR